MGDQKFCEGLNRMVFHLFAHQAYDTMVPGLTHRKWGQHIQRHNTWWDYSRPWMDYLARCQHLLQQGQCVTDVVCWFGEGAPLNVNDMTLDMPPGYDFDLCSAEMVLEMKVQDGRLVLPSGANYRYLRLPEADRLTPRLARKIRELVDGGARVIGGPRPKGSPSLADFPRCDAEVAQIAADLWDGRRITTGKTLAEVFAHDQLPPDFEGEGLRYIHRRVGQTDVYFVSHLENRAREATCTFRVAGRQPELWDPESGAIRALPEFAERDGRIAVPLHFDPAQSWFVVFRKPAVVAAAARKEEHRRSAAAAGDQRPLAGRFRSEMGRAGQAGYFRATGGLEQTRRPRHPLLLRHGRLPHLVPVRRSAAPVAPAARPRLGGGDGPGQGQRPGLRYRLEAAVPS